MIEEWRRPRLSSRGNVRRTGAVMVGLAGLVLAAGRASAQAAGRPSGAAPQTLKAEIAHDKAIVAARYHHCSALHLSPPHCPQPNGPTILQRQYHARVDEQGVRTSGGIDLGHEFEIENHWRTLRPHADAEWHQEGEIIADGCCARSSVRGRPSYDRSCNSYMPTKKISLRTGGFR